MLGCEVGCCVGCGVPTVAARAVRARLGWRVRGGVSLLYSNVVVGSCFRYCHCPWDFLKRTPHRLSNSGDAPVAAPLWQGGLC